MAVDESDLSPDTEEEEKKSNEMVEYELDSNAENRDDKKKKKFDYDVTNEYINPIVVKAPSGVISVGTTSKNKEAREALCWNCKVRLLYMETEDNVRCYNCHEVNDMKINNGDDFVFIKCPD